LFKFWEGDVSPTTGSSFTLTNKNWFNGKKAGENVELGFQMSFSGGVEPTISGVTLNGLNACSVEEPSLPPVPSITSPAPLTVPYPALGPSPTPSAGITHLVHDYSSA
jgi:hypothetical protein